MGNASIEAIVGCTMPPSDTAAVVDIVDFVVERTSVQMGYSN